MSIHANAGILLAWLHDRPGATVSDVVACGLMTSRTASRALQYAVDCGALKRVVLSRSSPKGQGRIFYLVTGVPLPEQRIVAHPCFDELIKAWHISLEPLQLASIETHIHQMPWGE